MLTANGTPVPVRVTKKSPVLAITVCPATSGLAVEAKHGTTTLTGVTDTDGYVEIPVNAFGAWEVSAEYEGGRKSAIAAVGEVAVYPVKLAGIYGVEWDGSSVKTLSRTDDAELFSDPVPYVAGMTADQCSSPFDSIMPWSGVRRVTDSAGGELVEIPKFWFRWTKEGRALKLQICACPVEGFHVSPAHADRGDGKGERDFVYVGRYHSGPSYKSVSGVAPQSRITITTARNYAHSLGADFYQYDMPMRMTLFMLYLVEFANWDCQQVIGAGCGNGSSVENVGKTDAMPYHTGTMMSSREAYGAGVQYRYVEGLWDNVYDYIDGCYHYNGGIYVIFNPGSFSESTAGILIGRPPNAGWITAFDVCEIPGYEWMIYVSEADNNAINLYVSDYYNFATGRQRGYLYWGGCYNNCGPHVGWFFGGEASASNAVGESGYRVQKLP